MPKLVKILGTKDPERLNKLWEQYSCHERKSGFRSGLIWGIAATMFFMSLALMVAKGWLN
jgi:hypothetical protein